MEEQSKEQPQKIQVTLENAPKLTVHYLETIAIQLTRIANSLEKK